MPQVTCNHCFAVIDLPENHPSRSITCHMCKKEVHIQKTGGEPINPFGVSSSEPVRKSKRSVDESSYVKQAKVIAIIMIVNGCLLGLMALYFLIYPLFMDQVMAAQNMNQFNKNPNMNMNQFILGMKAYFYVAGGLALISSLLQIIVGIMNLNWKGRTFGILALSSNLGGVATCYCIPFCLGVMIWGLIVYLNGDVKIKYEQNN